MPNLQTLMQVWDRVRTSLWFVPGLMALGALILAFLTPEIDRAVPDTWLHKLPLVFSGQPIGARAVLSTIATSMIATAGVVFSMTIVSLQLASSQFGPRLLRTFLRDRGNQVVLGAFVGIFLYCILVLPTINTTTDAVFVPHIAVTIALLLAIVGLGMLVYFIDHVAQSIHADAVIERVGDELDTVIDELFPAPVGEGDGGDPEDDAPDPTPSTPGRPWTATAAGAGYLRFVNGESLVCAAVAHDLFIRLEAAPGQYVFEGDALAAVWPETAITDELAAQIREAFVQGSHRTPLQDAPFAFEQLAEMAVRALSPGINDPTTAIHCIDRIGSGLVRLVSRRRPSPWRRDEKGVVRLRAEPVGLERILEGTVDPLARNAAAQLPVWLRLLDVLEKTFDRARRAEDREIVRTRADTLAGRAHEQFARDDDRSRLAAASAWTT